VKKKLSYTLTLYITNDQRLTTLKIGVKRN